MISPIYRLPSGTVRLVRGRQLRLRGPATFPRKCDRQHGSWQNPGGFTVIGVLSDEHGLGTVLHVSMSIANGSDPNAQDVAEVALAFFPDGVEVFRVGEGAVVHLFSDAKAAEQAGEAVMQIREAVDRMFKIRSAAKK